MHATIQKSLEEILGFFKDGEKVFVVGCSNCAAKCHSGGEEETEFMAERLKAKGIEVTGWAAPPNGGSLCKLSIAEKMLNEDHKEASKKADSFLILSCGQGVHTVMPYQIRSKARLLPGYPASLKQASILSGYGTATVLTAALIHAIRSCMQAERR